MPPVSYTHLKFTQAEVVFNHRITGVAFEPCYGQFAVAYGTAADDFFHTHNSFLVMEDNINIKYKLKKVN